MKPEQAKEIQQELDDIRSLMSTPAGRRCMWRILGKARVFSTCYTGNSETFYREGRRDYGLEIFAQVMEACPDLYAEAIKEMHILNTQKKDKTT